LLASRDRQDAAGHARASWAHTSAITPADAAAVSPECAAASHAPSRVVAGPGAANGLAVICVSADFKTMVRHALIRYTYRQERI